jgi:hypothetical protein
MMELKEKQDASSLAEAIRLLGFCNSKTSVSSYFFLRLEAYGFKRKYTVN